MKPGKPNWYWCQGCRNLDIANMGPKFRIRPTWKKVLRPKFRKLNQRIDALETEVALLRDEVHFLKSKLGGTAPRPSVTQQVRDLTELTPEAIATVVGKSEAVRQAVYREQKRRDSVTPCHT